VSEQLWNFASVEDGSREIQHAAASAAALLDQGKVSLVSLAAALGSSSRQSHLDVQEHWDNASGELISALRELARAVDDATGTDEY
jgi:early secretory antigenic target protein ESAT-6